MAFDIASTDSCKERLALKSSCVAGTLTAARHCSPSPTSWKRDLHRSPRLIRHANTNSTSNSATNSNAVIRLHPWLLCISHRSGIAPGSRRDGSCTTTQRVVHCGRRSSSGAGMLRRHNRGNTAPRSPCLTWHCLSSVLTASKLCAARPASRLLTGKRPDTTRVWDLATHFRNDIT